MDMLDDLREVIRNGKSSAKDQKYIHAIAYTHIVEIEALLLLIVLTDANADIQKIVAFENAFDRLLAIITQEGGIQGGIVSQDCLQLIYNLLRYNASNQVCINVDECIIDVNPISIELFPRDWRYSKDNSTA
jgi:hypothetical protein